MCGWCLDYCLWKWAKFWCLIKYVGRPRDQEKQEDWAWFCGNIWLEQVISQAWFWLDQMDEFMTKYSLMTHANTWHVLSLAIDQDFLHFLEQNRGLLLQEEEVVQAREKERREERKQERKKEKRRKTALFHYVFT